MKSRNSLAVLVSDISAQQSLLSGVETDRCNICAPAVARSVCCTSSLLIWETELWGSIMVSENWCSWYLTDISYGGSGDFTGLIQSWSDECSAAQHWQHLALNPTVSLLLCWPSCWKGAFALKNASRFYKFLNFVNNILRRVKCWALHFW